MKFALIFRPISEIWLGLQELKAMALHVVSCSLFYFPAIEMVLPLSPLPQKHKTCTKTKSEPLLWILLCLVPSDDSVEHFHDYSIIFYCVSLLSHLISVYCAVFLLYHFLLCSFYLYCINFFLCPLNVQGKYEYNQYGSAFFGVMVEMHLWNHFIKNVSKRQRKLFLHPCLAKRKRKTIDKRALLSACCWTMKSL